MSLLHRQASAASGAAAAAAAAAGDGASPDSPVGVHCLNVPSWVSNPPIEAVVFAWGASEDHQLGLDTVGDINSPKVVESLLGIKFMGRSFGCCPLVGGSRNTLAIDADGGLWSWGWNDRGTLGTGHRELQRKPAPVEALAGVTIVQAAIGGWHCLALSDEGQVYCWGGNEYQQCGLVAPDDFGPPASNSHSEQQQQQHNGYDVPAAAAAKLAASGTGGSSAGRWLGSSSGGGGGGSDAGVLPAVRDILRPLRCMPGLRVKQVACGGMNSVVLTESGEVWTWGEPWGEFALELQRAPRKVPGATGIAAIACGSFHNLALVADGRVLSWGTNDYGQLGNGSTRYSVTPGEVVDLADVAVADIAAGGWHSMALTADGQIYVWGRGEYGRLGIADRTGSSKLRPHRVRGLEGHTVVQVAAGGTHSLAVTAAGRMFIWGRASYGRLGLGPGAGDAAAPVEAALPGGHERWRIVAATAGGRHTMCLAVPVRDMGGSSSRARESDSRPGSVVGNSRGPSRAASVQGEPAGGSAAAAGNGGGGFGSRLGSSGGAAGSSNSLPDSAARQQQQQVAVAVAGGRSNSGGDDPRDPFAAQQQQAVTAADDDCPSLTLPAVKLTSNGSATPQLPSPTAVAAAAAAAAAASSSSAQPQQGGGGVSVSGGQGGGGVSGGPYQPGQALPHGAALSTATSYSFAPSPGSSILGVGSPSRGDASNAMAFSPVAPGMRGAGLQPMGVDAVHAATAAAAAHLGGVRVGSPVPGAGSGSGSSNGRLQLQQLRPGQQLPVSPRGIQPPMSPSQRRVGFDSATGSSGLAEFPSLTEAPDGRLDSDLPDVGSQQQLMRQLMQQQELEEEQEELARQQQEEEEEEEEQAAEEEEEEAALQQQQHLRHLGFEANGAAAAAPAMPPRPGSSGSGTWGGGGPQAPRQLAGSPLQQQQIQQQQQQQQLLSPRAGSGLARSGSSGALSGLTRQQSAALQAAVAGSYSRVDAGRQASASSLPILAGPPGVLRGRGRRGGVSRVDSDISQEGLSGLAGPEGTSPADSAGALGGGSPTGSVSGGSSGGGPRGEAGSPPGGRYELGLEDAAARYSSSLPEREQNHLTTHLS